MDINSIVVDESRLSIVNKAFEDYQKYGMDCSFRMHLFKLIEKADSKNIVKLSFAYPEEVYCYMIWAFGDKPSYFESIGLKFKLFKGVK